jgi:O-antigen/teichoic acid export membrane protein
MQFSSGFQTALRPQLTKSVATESPEEQNRLIQRFSKFSYYLFLLITLPVLINTDYLLTLWLKVVPDYTVIFCRLIIIGMMIDVISSPLWVVVFATGKIRNYQIIISIVLLLNVLFSYVFSKSGYSPEWVLYTRVLLFSIALIVRLFFVNYLIEFNLKAFIKKVIFPIIFVTVISFPLPYQIGLKLTKLSALLVTGTVSTIISCLTIYLIGIDQDERLFVKHLINKCKIILVGQNGH